MPACRSAIRRAVCVWALACPHRACVRVWHVDACVEQGTKPCTRPSASLVYRELMWGFHRVRGWGVAQGWEGGTSRYAA